MSQIEGLNKIGEFTPNGGYIPSAPKEGGTGYMSSGSENGMLSGVSKVQAFKGMTQIATVKGGFAMSNVAETYASLGQTSDTTGYGNVMNVLAALFFIGKGLLRLAGASLAVNASATLNLLIKRTGSYTDVDSGPWQAGLAAPSAPVIWAEVPGAGQTGKVNGTVSVVIWRIRSTTGAVSNASPVSNIITVTNQSVAIQFPSLDANGQDAWGIGVTKQIEGRVGSHFELMEIMDTELDGSRVIVVEWRDGDLLGKEFAPKRSFPPPSALFAGVLEDVLFVDGAYADAESATSDTVRGTALAPSEPGRPESFSPDTVIFTSDTPTALIRGDGVYWRFGKNSVHVVRYLGGPKPLTMEPVWEGLGIEYQHQAVLARGGQLYLWPVGRGLLRMGQDGFPEGEWATAIEEDLIGMTAANRRVLGYDGIHQVVAVCYLKKIWPYFVSLGLWGAPADVTASGIGNIKASITIDNQLLLIDDADNIWRYNVGTGSVLKYRTPWVTSPGVMDTVAAVLTSIRADNTANPVSIKVYADGDPDTAISTHTITPARTGYQRLPAVWPNVIDCEQHAVEVSITSNTANGDCGIESIQSFGPSHSTVR